MGFYISDPELELRLGSGHQGLSADSDSLRKTMVEDWFANTITRYQNPKQKQQQQQITIFYNGKICVGDVTDLQASAILCMARREMEEKTSMPTKNASPTSSSSSSQSRPSTPPLAIVQPQVTNPGLSMKRSLQRFLQKRKMRIDAASPYYCRPPPSS